MEPAPAGYDGRPAGRASHRDGEAILLTATTGELLPRAERRRVLRHLGLPDK